MAKQLKYRDTGDVIEVGDCCYIHSSDISAVEYGQEVTVAEIDVNDVRVTWNDGDNSYWVSYTDLGYDEPEPAPAEDEPTPTEAPRLYVVGDRVRLMRRGDHGGDWPTGPALGDTGTVVEARNDWRGATMYQSRWPDEQFLRVKFEQFGETWYTNSGRIELIDALAESEEDSMAPPTPSKPVATGPSGAAPEIVRTGKQIILPDGMTLKDGIAWLTRRATEEQTPVAVNHVFNKAYIVDALVATHRALADLYNWVDNVPTPSFFGPEPPTMVTIRTGPGTGDFISAPWGRVKVPGMSGHLEVGVFQTKKGGQPYLRLGGEVRQGDMPKVREIITRAEERLKSASLYKGKAIKVSWAWERDGEPFNFETSPPSFMDVSGADEHGLIFSEQVQRDLDQGLFYLLEHTDAMRANGVPLKKGVLIEGPYGTGKTLAALVAFKKAIRNGWTAIYLDNVLDLRRGLEFAATLGVPCLIHAEDVERVAGLDRDEAANEVINCLDGIDTKAHEIIVTLTSNHRDQINPALRREGRIDTFVSVRPPDAHAATRLLKLYGRGLIDPLADLGKVAKAVEGRIPAAIRDVVERSKVAAIGRTRSADIKGKVTEADLLASAAAKESHAAWLAADTKKPVETILSVPLTYIEKQLNGTVAEA